MPELYIITGSNGAGKSTVGFSYLPPHIQDRYSIFDGDKLFITKQKELWASGIRAHKEAKKIAYKFVSDTFDQLVTDAIANDDTFVYEGHFTNDATWDIPKKFKHAGYSVNMIFFGLINPDLSEMRVLDRVNNDKGHYVPRNTVEDNFYGNLEKLNQHFTLMDSLTIVDTSEATHIILAFFNKGKLESSISPDQLPEWFIKYLPQLSQQIL